MANKRLFSTGAWTSEKIAQIEPAEWRPEYSWVYAVACGDGTFEIDVRKIWAQAYAAARPNWSMENVRDLFKEFERVGLLETAKDEKGKLWGKWSGCEAHLPAPSQRHKYGKGRPDLFEGTRQVDNSYLEGTQAVANGYTLPSTGLGLGLGLGKGKGKGEDAVEDAQPQTGCAKPLSGRVGVSQTSFNPSTKLILQLNPTIEALEAGYKQQNDAAIANALKAAMAVFELQGFNEQQIDAGLLWVQKQALDGAEIGPPDALTDEIANLETLHAYMQANCTAPALPNGGKPAICFMDKNGNEVIKTEPPTPEELQHIVAQIKAGNPKAFGFGVLSPRADN
jgi:hypothetical protein